MPRNFRNMKLVLLLFFLGVLTVDADIERCREVLAQFNQCTKEAHMNYVAAVNKGGDGRPDFHARKACNYAEEAIQGCGNQLAGECFTQEQVDEKKDAEIAIILRSLESQIPNWDTSKCPAVTLSAFKPTYRPTYMPTGSTGRYGSYETTYRPLRRTPTYSMSSATSAFPSSIFILLAIAIGTMLKTV